MKTAENLCFGFGCWGKDFFAKVSYNKIFEKKGRLKTKRGFQTAFSLYVGLNENGTISLLPGLGKAESHGRLFAFIESITWSQRL